MWPLCSKHKHLLLNNAISTDNESLNLWITKHGGINVIITYIEIIFRKMYTCYFKGTKLL